MSADKLTSDLYYLNKELAAYPLNQWQHHMIGLHDSYEERQKLVLEAYFLGYIDGLDISCRRLIKYQASLNHPPARDAVGDILAKVTAYMDEVKNSRQCQHLRARKFEF